MLDRRERVARRLPAADVDDDHGADNLGVDLHDQAGILAGEGDAVSIDELDDSLKSSAKARDLGRGFFAPRGLQRLAGDLVLRGRGLEGRIMRRYVVWQSALPDGGG